MEPITLPIERESPFDPPAELARLRESEPITRLAFPDGHVGWLVTDHATARAVLSDPRFSNRQELRHMPFKSALAELQGKPARPGFFLRTDPPEHTRFRRQLTGQFTVRRMNQLTPRIEEIVTQHLDAMEENGPPVDLVEAFALPIPSLVICELLGVPYADRERFQSDTRIVVNLNSTPEQAANAVADLMTYLADLVTSKRSAPSDDIIGGLIEAGELNDEEITGVALLLLIAGHETTANMLSLGTFTLLQHPEQLERLRSDPDLIANAVEELLRYLTIVQFGTIRAALEDIELAGRTVAAGENVVLSLPAGNRDPERFENAEALDIERPATGHVAFGHGIHQCLGQQLARIEMRIGYQRLFERFPALRLAVPAEEVPVKTDMAIYGVHRLPITW